MLKITPASHLDHGLNGKQLAHVLKRFAERDAFFVETFDLPEELGTVPCGLHGPLMGDAPVAESFVAYQTRGERTWPSRIAVARGVRQTRKVTIVAGPHEGDACIIYTIYGGPQAPKEATDPTLAPEKRAESVDFWAAHALSKES